MEEHFESQIEEPMYTVDPEERQQIIAETAYFIAEQRGFNGHHPMDDWLQAEAEADAQYKININGEFGDQPDHEAQSNSLD